MKTQQGELRAEPALAGARVLITGAGRGLGAALAICLADTGCRVIVSARDLNNARRVANAIGARVGRPAEVLKLDLAAPDLPRVQRVVDTLGGLDILIHNAAEWQAQRDAPFAADEVSKVIDAAILGPFLLTQRLLPELVRSARAQVLTIGSTTAPSVAGLGDASVPFCAAKHGQRALMAAFHAALPDQRVRFHCIHPPRLDDVSPLDAAWDDSPSAVDRATNRDVVEMALFALTRRSHLLLPTVVLGTAGLPGNAMPCV